MAKAPPAPSRLPPPASWIRWRHEINMTLNDPTWNRFAMVYHPFIVFVIILSVIALMLESVPSYADAFNWYAFNFSVYTLFTIEYAARLLLHEGSRCQFAREPMNVVDLLAISPFLIEGLLDLELLLDPNSSPRLSAGALRVLRVARLFRLVRLLRLAKYSTDLRMVAEGLYRSRNALYTLAFMLMLSVIIFSSLMCACRTGPAREAK